MAAARALKRELLPSASGRSRRKPQRFDDFLPAPADLRRRVQESPPGPPSPGPSTSPPPSRATPSASESSDDSTSSSTSTPAYVTAPDPVTGFYREYPHAPTHDPDQNVNLDALCDSADLLTAATRPRTWFSGMTRSLAGLAPANIFAPFANATQFRVMDWLYGSPSGEMSNAAGDALIQNILLAPDFDPSHVADGFSIAKGEKMLDNAEFASEDGWHEATLQVPVPCTGHRFESEDAAPHFEVPGFIYRRILPVMVSFFKAARLDTVHFTPFKQFVKRADGLIERVYSELYNTAAWLDEHARIMVDHAANPMEKVIAAVLLYSDSTHLTQFGGKSAWPIYLFWGNQSKYTRTKPSMFSAQHIGYIPPVRYYSLAQASACADTSLCQIPETFKDWFSDQFGKLPNADTMAHMKREIMSAVWMLMLDPELMHAYVHGVVIECADGVERLFFPRFFVYSADYPEK
jgi:hypothetical protein